MADLENSLCFRAMFSNSAQTNVTVSFSSRADSTLEMPLEFRLAYAKGKWCSSFKHDLLIREMLLVDFMSWYSLGSIPPHLMWVHEEQPSHQVAWWLRATIRPHSEHFCKLRPWISAYITIVKSKLKQLSSCYSKSLLTSSSYRHGLLST